MNGNEPVTVPRGDVENARAESSECFDEERVMAFVDGRLDKAAGFAFEKHLDTCDACRELVGVLAAEEGADRVAEGARNIRASAASHEDMLRVLDPDSLAPGTVLAGRFRIIESLGTGATATTYRVADEQLGEESALKVLKDESGAASRLVARELVIARKLNHPNVCRVHDVGSEDGVHFFGMELIQGETLEKALRRGIEQSAVLGILDQVCAGMEAAHKQGIVHRDLKPANIMIEKATKRVVLMDFGLAADLGSEESRAKIVGTPAYWAPEQARGEEPSTASDIYSFGLIAYKMFSGRAFRLSDPDALSHVPRASRAVVARCLDASPSARYQDASELRRALQEPPSSRARLALIGLVLVVGVGGVAFAMSNNTSSAKPSPSTDPIADPATTATVATAATTSPVVSASVSTPHDVPSTVPSATAVSTSKPARVDKGTHPPAIANPAISTAKASVSAAAVASAPTASASPVATSPASDLLYKR